MTNQGGANNHGVLFEYDPATSTYSKKLDFNNTTNGAGPKGNLTQAGNGKLYGMTNYGGASGTGVLFEYDPATSTYTKKLDFINNTTGFYPNGSLAIAANGKLYGTTTSGGANNGVLFEYDPATSTFTKKFDFNGANGSNPGSSLNLATNGKLYGLTQDGGSLSDGVLFEYDPATSSFAKKLDFNLTEGESPRGSLAQASNGKFYGTTNGGGATGDGTLFEFDPATAMYTKKVDFIGANGLNPQGSLVLAGYGKMYGMTSDGGTNSAGVMFEYDPATSAFTKKLDFNYTTTGGNPYGSLVLAGNGKLYGLTAYGGVNDKGVIFEYDPATNIYSKKIDFSSGSGGYQPEGDLMQATNGKLYGMTRLGGTSDLGVIFEYDIATNTIAKKVDFTGANGENPAGNLAQAPNGKLYGMTERGGANNIGVLFEYDPATSVYTKKLDFNGAANGGTPYGSLELSSNGKLYGFTTSGGVNNFGVLFEYDAATSTYTKKQDFAGANGAYPYKGSLLFSYCAIPATPTISVTNANTLSPTLTSSSTSGNQWFLNGAAINGGTNATYQVTLPGIYKVRVKDDVCLSNFSADQSFAIQTITFGALADKVLGDTPFALTGTASSGLSLSYTASSNKVSITGSQVSLVSAGRVTITASQSGAIGFLQAAYVNQSFCIKPATPVVTLSNANTASPTLTSSATVGNQWFRNGTAIAGATNPTISITQAGIYKVQVQVDDCISEFSTDQPFVTQSITFGALSDKVLGDTPFVLTGTTTSGLPLSYSTSSNKITIAGSLVSLSSAGRVTITASQSGAIGFLQAVSVDQSFCIKPAKPTISVSNTNTESPSLTSSSSSGNQWFRNGAIIAGATNAIYTVTQAGVYKVQVSVDDCLSEFSNDQAIIITGDLQKDANLVSVYPNPVSDWLTVRLGTSSSQNEVVIYQLGGKKMTSQKVSADEARFYVADYTQGVYVVRIITPDGVSVMRFMKQ